MNTRSIVLEPKVLSVSELNAQSRQLLEKKFASVTVEGEVSQFNTPASGHWYLTLIDENAQLACIMFANANRQVTFTPEVGGKIQVKGKISLFEPRGTFQLVATEIKQAGAGALQQNFEQLKKRLQDEGLFAQERKKQIPNDPSAIAVITSLKGGVVLYDILTVLKKRAPAIKVYVLPSTVQGSKGGSEIIKALKLAEELEGIYKPELILLARGGGSTEDLWNFNEERVVRAIGACTLPTVSAIGHETDYTLADFVADERAPTPSAAGALISPDNRQRLQLLEQYNQNLERVMARYLETCRITMRHCVQRLKHPREHIQRRAQLVDILHERLTRGINAKLQQYRTTPERYAQRLHTSWQHIVERHRTRLERAFEKLNLVNPLNILKRGYSIIRDDRRNVVYDVTQVQKGEVVEAQLAKGTLACQIKDVSNTDPASS